MSFFGTSKSISIVSQSASYNFVFYVPPGPYISLSVPRLLQIYSSCFGLGLHIFSSNILQIASLYAPLAVAKVKKHYI